MGMFDTIVGECPRCKAPYEGQTKLAQCAMDEIYIGGPIELDDVALELKDPCECGALITAVVKDGVLVELREGGAQLREGLWGAVAPATGDREQQRDEQMKAFVGTVNAITKARDES